MANFKQHATTGIASCVAVELFQLMRENGKGEMTVKVFLYRLFLAAVGGFIGASIPDTLEPANNYNHRSVFHSVCAGGAVGYVAYATMRENGLVSNQYANALARGAAVGYGSHLVLDARTPMRLPFLL